MPRGEADAYSIPFKQRFVRVVLATLVRQEQKRLRKLSAKQDGDALLTRAQASVLLEWHKRMKSHACAKGIEGDGRSVHQLLGTAAVSVAWWDDTVALDEFFDTHFGGSRRTRAPSSLARFLRLPYAPSFLDSDRHPQEVRAEFEMFVDRAWVLWLLRDMQNDGPMLDMLCRRLCAIAVAERASRTAVGQARTPAEIQTQHREERARASQEFAAALEKLEGGPMPSGELRSVSDLLNRSGEYAASLGVKNVSAAFLESRLPGACYAMPRMSLRPPDLADVIGHFKRIAARADTWAAEVRSTLDLARDARAFECARWTGVRGLSPAGSVADIRIEGGMPNWLGKWDSTVAAMGIPGNAGIWLTTSVSSSDSRMAAELASIRFERLLDAIALLHRQPVAARSSGVFVWDVNRQKILLPGSRSDTRPHVSSQLGESELKEMSRLLLRMSHDHRPFVRHAARAVTIWRSALEEENLESRFVGLWRAFEAIVGPFKRKGRNARNDLHPLLLCRATGDSEQQVLGRYETVFRLRNHWAVHPAEDRPEVAVAFVPQFQLRAICDWFAKDVWLLAVYTAELAEDHPDQSTRSGLAFAVGPTRYRREAREPARCRMLNGLYVWLRSKLMCPRS